MIVLHQGNPYIGSRLRNEFGGVVETNIVDIGSACYDPFYDLDGGAISELVMGLHPRALILSIMPSITLKALLNC